MIEEQSQKGVSPLQELLNRAGVTQKQLGDALGVSPQTVNNWIHGRFVKEPVKLSVRQFKTLCFILNCTLEEIPEDFGPQPQMILPPVSTTTDELTSLSYGTGRRRRRTRAS